MLVFIEFAGFFISGVAATLAFFSSGFAVLNEMVVSSLSSEHHVSEHNQEFRGARAALNCGTIAIPDSNASPALRYCFYPPEQRPDRLVYFFHGYGNDHRAELYNPVIEYFKGQWRRQDARVLLVTLSFGPSRIVPLEVKTKDLAPNLMARLETQLSEASGFDLTQIPRTLLGDSLGGHNALLWWSAMPERFDRLALFCPALPAVDPFDGPHQLSLFPTFAEILLRSHYRQQATWQSSNPLTQVASLRLQDLPQGFSVFIGLIHKDIYRFIDGPLRLAEKFAAKGIQAEVQFLEGSHCRFYSDRFAAFIAGG
jgi:pimeloyl-ACP methyl ester carboxylesterase